MNIVRRKQNKQENITRFKNFKKNRPKNIFGSLLYKIERPTLFMCKT